MNGKAEDDEFFKIIADTFNDRIPFNKVLGLRVESISQDGVKMKLAMRDELVGNFMRGNLHGGVISSSLDVIGGMVAFLSVLKRQPGISKDEKLREFGKLGTIDLRVDYLRPGHGSCFIASGYALRTGNKVAVTRSELRNEEDELIAVGTGTYIVG